MEKEKVIERVKQIKARLLSYPMDAIADIHFILEFSSNLIDETEKEVKENERLKEQLDREIKINRKMKSCLSAFARRDNWKAIEGCADWVFLLDPLMAEETLKEIDNEE